MIRIKLKNQGDVFETLLLEDRTDVGPEIRQWDAPGCDAAQFVPVDVDVEHCNACDASQDDRVGVVLGLTDDELDTLVRWRTAKQDGVSLAEMGRILDKLCARLNRHASCDRDHHRIVIEVEPVP